MNMKKTAPYGSWQSPITSDLIVSKSVGLRALHLDADAAYWLESRPTEKGRNVIVKHLEDGSMIDINPIPFNARTRVHEYGGGAVFIHADVTYFVNFVDQRLYRVISGQKPVSLTPDLPLRYADFELDALGNRLICVREDHRESSMASNHNEAVNTLTAINLDGSGYQQVLVSGNDFYSSPRLSPDGKRLSWLTWNHPNMPWDGCELWVADMQPDGNLINPKIIAGGIDESIFQPEWSPDGVLTFISDRSGWWNIYRQVDEDSVCITKKKADFGVPQWQFGLSTYTYISNSEIVCIDTENGSDHLNILDVITGELHPLDLPFTSLSDIKSFGSSVIFRGATPETSNAVILYDLISNTYRILKSSTSLDVDNKYISKPEFITYPSRHNMPVHAFYYAPQNPAYTASETEKPPLLVMSHGGPTGMTKNTLNLQLQFWTSRGFAVLDVNYGGSVGFGRAYRDRLNGNWGITDVEDCVSGAVYLAKNGLVDENRLAIRGGSAGGYTTLAALAFKNVFHAGASYYGVSDLEALALDTHKFESRYLDGLVGPYPQMKDLYYDRSPIHHVDELNCPIIFFQGSEDRVVPPNQARTMVDALIQKGLPVAYILFEGEQHGFRQATSIKRALDAELFFYSQLFCFTPFDDIEPVEITNSMK